MQLQQYRWTDGGGWKWRSGCEALPLADLVLAFGGAERLAKEDWYPELRARYPEAQIVSVTTAGEISDIEITDCSIVVTAIKLRAATVRAIAFDIENESASAEVAAKLGRELATPGLRHVLVFSEGVRVNGSELVRGLRETLPEGVAATGGLAGDGARMQSTLVGLNEAPRVGRIVGIGLYGDSLECRVGSQGGWDPFGPTRKVTRSSSNVVYELDGRPALALYKEYLGEHAAGLPSTGLLFPLAVELANGESLVRTLLGVDEAKNSVTFAGDVPEGATVRLMHANFDRLVDGAQIAATECSSAGSDKLALLVSCVGRKLLLGPRTEEEVEATREALGEGPTLAGFYSYGEIAPLGGRFGCELHNQTMTITTIAEAVA